MINNKRERGQIVINAPLCSKIQHSSYTALHPNLHGAGGKMSLKLLRVIGWLLMRVNLFGFCFIKYIKAKKKKRIRFGSTVESFIRPKLLKTAEK